MNSRLSFLSLFSTSQKKKEYFLSLEPDTVAALFHKTRFAFFGIERERRVVIVVCVVKQSLTTRFFISLAFSVEISLPFVFVR